MYASLFTISSLETIRPKTFRGSEFVKMIQYVVYLLAIQKQFVILYIFLFLKSVN
jgi:hypothetical protein